MIDCKMLQHKVEATDGKKIWYIAELLGIVMELDIESAILKCIWKIPGNPKAVSYRGIFYYMDKLYIIPYGGSLYEYDLVKHEYKLIVMDNCELMGAIKRGDYLYLYGEKSIVVKLSLKDYTLQYLDFAASGLTIDFVLSNCFWVESLIYNENIYLPVQNSNVVIRIDNNDVFSVVRLGNSTEKWIARNIDIYENKFHSVYLSAERENMIIVSEVYSLEGKLIESVKVPFCDEYKIYPFVYASFYEGDWIIFPYGAENFYAVDAKNAFLSRMHPCIFRNNGQQESITGAYTCAVQAAGSILYGINQITGQLVTIDSLKKVVKEKSIMYDGTLVAGMLLKEILSGEKPAVTEDYVKLSDFLNIVAKI